MTTQQENRLKMYCATRDYLEANVKITRGLPEFEKYFNLLEKTIGEIRVQEEIQKLDRKGNKLEKIQIRNELILITICCANKLRLYAVLKKKRALETEVKFSPSTLKKSADSGVKDTAMLVYDKLEANPGLLTEFNITKVSQNDFLNLIERYEASIKKTRFGISEKKLATGKLAVMFKEAEGILGYIDLIINILMFERPEFYEGYRRVRKVV